jgi:uncharacterized protein (DUF2267 family)
VQRANTWLADVTAALGTQDRQYARRMLRTWLHILRDRLTVEAAAKFGQQLPELLRGTYYDGWEPNRVPVKYHAAEYVHRFAREAMVPPAEVPGISATITYVIDGHMSPGQVDEALAELPASLRATIRGGAAVAEPGVRAAAPATTLDERLETLTEAVRALARGLESNTTGGPVDPAQVARAARLAEEMLVASSPR